MQISIEAALQIQGWMSENELMWLARQARAHKRIIEIGCWRGRSTRALADNTLGVVVAVDTFMGSKDTAEELKLHPQGWLFREFRRNMNGLSNVLIAPIDSLITAKVVKEHCKKPDMIFIDGAHDYDTVRADILAWRSLLSAGGLLCGHDYDCIGVSRAVNELLPKARQVFGSIWECKT